MAAFLVPFACPVHGTSSRSSSFTHRPSVSLRPLRVLPASPARTDIDRYERIPRRRPAVTAPMMRSFNKPAPKPFSKNSRKKRGERKPTPLHKLRVGERLEGTVRNLVPWGAYIDVGAVRDGLVHLRNLSEDYVEHPQEIVVPGDVVHAYVKYVDPEKKVLGLSLIPIVMDYEWSERTPVDQLEPGGRKIARVIRITNYGAFVDIGATRDAWVHIGNLWGESTKKTLNELMLGEKFDVVVESVDVKKSFINCRARTKFGTKKLTAEPEADGEEKELVVKWEEDYGHRGPGCIGEDRPKAEDWLAVVADEPKKKEQDREAEDQEAGDGVGGQKEKDPESAKLEEKIADMLKELRVEETDDEFDGLEEEFDGTDDEWDDTDEEEDETGEEEDAIDEKE